MAKGAQRVKAPLRDANAKAKAGDDMGLGKLNLEGGDMRSARSGAGGATARMDKAEGFAGETQTFRCPPPYARGPRCTCRPTPPRPRVRRTSHLARYDVLVWPTHILDAFLLAS